MSPYRIYLLDHRGRFARVLVHEARSDEDALRAAEALNHPHGTEVWDHGRRVVPSSPAPSRPSHMALLNFGQTTPEPI